MRLLSEFTQWGSYLNTVVARAEIDESEAENLHGDLRAAKLVHNWGGGKDDRVTLSKAESDIDPHVRDARDNYEQARAYRKMVARLYENTCSEAAVLSRELTRRVGREAPERRERKYST
jgi:hypothetical protein